MIHLAVIRPMMMEKHHLASMTTQAESRRRICAVPQRHSRDKFHGAPPGAASRPRLHAPKREEPSTIPGEAQPCRDNGFGAGVKEAGFSLIELLVVTMILPVIAGAIVVAFITFLSLHTSVANRVLDAADAQVVSSNFETDVHSATQITTSSTATECGTGPQILGLRWNLDSQGGYQKTVSYVRAQQGSTYSLVRNQCVNGSLTASTTNAVATDVPSNQGPPAIVPPSASTAAAAGYTSTQGVTSVSLSITAPRSNHTYTLVADPATNATNNPGGTTLTTNTSCAFASPGTGTYASTLCFVDFTGLQSGGAPTSYCPGQGQSEIDAGVLNTPYALKFCVSATGTAVAPNGIPTYPYTSYSDGTSSEAFLGNNGFYAGIPGQPALYQQNNGDTFVYLTKIQLLDASGTAASGWSLVTGDAESSDNREGMIYTTCPTVANPGHDSSGELSWSPGYAACAPSSQAPAFTLVPNSSSSAFGNSCHAPYYPSTAAGWDNFRFSGAAFPDVLNNGHVAGTNTNTVQCFATVSSDKTGTVMLAAPTPSNITVFMHGDGLAAMFVGLQLP
jgi:prepilin-type N-terminal cleavage/methylation domain-containing protein